MKIHEKIIVIGGSAGSLEVLSDILPKCALPNSPPIVVVLHLGETLTGSVSSFFQKRCIATVKEAEPTEPLLIGHVYFAPPGYHLLISQKRCCELNVDDPVMFSRPSIDVLFESVADAYGKNALGVLLSGANGDGAAGLRQLEEKNARVVVQNPETAMFSEMPRSAILQLKNPLILDASAICTLICEEAKCP